MFLCLNYCFICVEMTRLGELLHSMLFVGRWHLFYSIANAITRRSLLAIARTDPDEIKENVPMITDVHRIVVKRNNLEVKTNTLILTFITPKIPDSILKNYLNIPVSQYVPNPIRCYKCM